ncbi:MAG: hypothetical protein A2017_07115 [Lentisphaerae bacterium GWF2_44_16]|nr:MAG: hypothetical protein A2017_07115 [Lentisphaerae bacterium GWF2_44_16]
MNKSDKSEIVSSNIDKAIFNPLADIYEEKDSVILLAEMPGVNEKNIDISVENNVLTITGIQDEEDFKGYELMHRSYNTGIYKRSFSMAGDIDSSNINAKISNGILRIVLPKMEKAKPKKITVQAEN